MGFLSKPNQSLWIKQGRGQSTYLIVNGCPWPSLLPLPLALQLLPSLLYLPPSLHVQYTFPLRHLPLCPPLPPCQPTSHAFKVEDTTLPALSMWGAATMNFTVLPMSTQAWCLWHRPHPDRGLGLSNFVSPHIAYNLVLRLSPRFQRLCPLVGLAIVSPTNLVDGCIPSL